MLPDQVVIGPYTYAVLYAPLEDQTLKGETSCEGLLIHIDQGFPEQRVRATLWHEVLHALMDLIGSPLSDRVEEDLVHRLAPALVDVLDRNPGLVRS